MKRMTDEISDLNSDFSLENSLKCVNLCMARVSLNCPNQLECVAFWSKFSSINKLKVASSQLTGYIQII